MLSKELAFPVLGATAKRSGTWSWDAQLPPPTYQCSKCVSRLAGRSRTEPPGFSSVVSMSIFNISSSAASSKHSRATPLSLPFIVLWESSIFPFLVFFVFSFAFYILYLSLKMFCTFFFFLRKEVHLCIYRYLHDIL